MYEAYFNLGNVLFEKMPVRPGARSSIVTPWRFGPTARRLKPRWNSAGSGLASTNDVESIPEVAATVCTRYDRIGIQGRKLDCMLDPEIYGRRLRELHMVVVDINTNSSTILEFISLKSKVEEAIRELSICILTTKDPKLNLDDQIQKFDEVMVKLKQMNAILQKRMCHAKTLSQEFLKG